MPVSILTARTLKPRVSASFAAVAATVLGFVIVASFNVPIAGNFKVLGGGRAPAPAMLARCLELSYGGSEYTWLPASVRLTGEVSHPNAPRGPLYRAFDEHGTPWEWRPAGPDSIDVASHHSPVIRVPARGRRVVGRVGMGGYRTLWEALTAPRDGWVAAREVRCPPPEPA